ncbi:MAG: hypothetical protein WBW25_09290, partial [Halobacteriota archaeon]
LTSCKTVFLLYPEFMLCSSSVCTFEAPNVLRVTVPKAAGYLVLKIPFASRCSIAYFTTLLN